MDKVSIVLKDGRKINLELDRASAPITVENFLKLVDNGFYNGLCFHRVISGFMIQGGGMVQEKGVLIEKRGLKPIKGEFLNNGFKNDIKHELGVISMARTNEPNSATSQFFICAADCDFLDKNYAAFGRTIDAESNKVVVDISNVKTHSYGWYNDIPNEPVVIDHVERI
ncbi:peptidyl-prolyl cis-trans isomerase [Faecalibacterium sp. CAG:1138]|nr:peptidyl-prolyl cis-trans isomerase [Faecalibacterium sp. CAG:1138]